MPVQIKNCCLTSRTLFALHKEVSTIGYNTNTNHLVIAVTTAADGEVGIHRILSNILEEAFVI